MKTRVNNVDQIQTSLTIASYFPERSRKDITNSLWEGALDSPSKYSSAEQKEIDRKNLHKW